MCVAWKSFGGTDVGAVDEPYPAYSAQPLVGPTRTRVWNGRALLEKRTMTGLETAKSSVLIAPHLCCTLVQPLRAPARLNFYIFIMSPTPNPFTLHTAFRLRNHWHGRHGKSPLSMLPLALLFLYPPRPSSSPFLADACLVIGRT